VCFECIGDWTKKVHQLTVKPTHRPAWIYGPFPSPGNEATYYENILAFASGAGITLAVNLAVTLGRSRRVNVVWMVRDPEIIEFYLKQRFYDDDGWTFIFYTGKKPLVITDRSIMGPMVMIFKGRPDLREVVKSIVNNIECGIPLSRDLIIRGMQADHEIFFKGDAEKCRDDVELAMHTFTAAELFAVCVEESKVVDAEMRAQLNAGLCTKKGIEHVFERQVWRAKDLLDPYEFMHKAFDKLQITETDVIDRDAFDSLIQILQGGNVRASVALSDADMSQRLQNLQNRSCLLSRSVSADTTDSYESACRGEEPGKTDIKRWCSVYCGGSKVVSKILKKIARESGMHSEFETFDW